VQKWLGNGNPKLPQQDRSWHCFHGWAFPDRRWPESSKVDCTRRTGQVTGKRISVQDSERTMFSARIGHVAVESAFRTSELLVLTSELLVLLLSPFEDRGDRSRFESRVLDVFAPADLAE